MCACLPVCVYVAGRVLDDLISKKGKTLEAKERMCFRRIIWTQCGRETSRDYCDDPRTKQQ